MDARLHFDIQVQPTETTCGPTCLQAVYGYHGDVVALDEVIGEVKRLPNGGTLGVLLGCHALARGYDVRIYTYNLQAFDPTWFHPTSRRPAVDLAKKLAQQRYHKDDPRLEHTVDAYLDYLALGGEVLFEDLTPALIRKHLSRGVPILTGLSSTYLYRAMREFGSDDHEDDVRGEPAGHFVVLCGYDRENRRVLVADPLEDNPASLGRTYEISIDRVICAILLGVLTYDANLVVIRPGEAATRPARGAAAP